MWRAMSLIVRFYLVDLKLHATLCVCVPVFATNTSLRMTMKHSCLSCSVDILCEASRVYSISPIRPTCLYSRLDYSRAIYQITAPRLSGSKRTVPMILGRAIIVEPSFLFVAMWDMHIGYANLSVVQSHSRAYLQTNSSDPPIIAMTKASSPPCDAAG
jgi:hypothetical protein